MSAPESPGSMRAWQVTAPGSIDSTPLRLVELPILYPGPSHRILSGLVQPLLFLFVLGYGMTGLVGSSGSINFHEFIFPGVVAMSAVMTAIFSAISIVWDRELGFLREMLVAPVSRTPKFRLAGPNPSMASIQGGLVVFGGLLATRTVRPPALPSAQRSGSSAAASLSTGVTVAGPTVPSGVDSAWCAVSSCAFSPL